MEPSRSLTLDEIDLSDFEFWTRPYEEREGAFLTLREEDPIRFFEEPRWRSLPPGPGYYALTRHADVLEASKHPQLFCSGRGTNIGDMPPDFLEFLGSMINMDDPKHARMRRIVSRGLHAAAARPDEGRRRGHRGRDRRRRHRARRGRLRHRHRRHPPAADHRRHDGDPAQPGEVHLRPHQRDPRARRRRVRARPDRGRRDDRPPHRGAGPQPAHHRARRRRG